MGTFNLTLNTTPHATAYDIANPTRSTELYCNAVHGILEDMDDQAYWYLSDGVLKTPYDANMKNYLFGLQEDVFDYAAQAIEDHRAEDPISITKPTATSLTAPVQTYREEANNIAIRAYDSAMKMLFLIFAVITL